MLLVVYDLNGVVCIYIYSLQAKRRMQCMYPRHVQLYMMTLSSFRLWVLTLYYNYTSSGLVYELEKSTEAIWRGNSPSHVCTSTVEVYLAEQTMSWVTFRCLNEIANCNSLLDLSGFQMFYIFVCFFLAFYLSNLQ